MTLSKEQIDLIVAEEEARWKSVHSAIVEEARRTNSDMRSDLHLARELTSEIVAARRDEDKAALASDEAVAHGLGKLRKGLTKDFKGLAKQPYFARVVTIEDGGEIEFFLGTASFPKYRIIDWRKAPISQLYYNYAEGDEFDEIIQGRDRHGYIKLRRGYKGFEDDLLAIELPEGIIRKEKTGWIFLEKEAVQSRSAGHDGHLPPILSLITADQFDLISHSPEKPVVIQGIAGSGKTTVALHRLAWLLHEDNSSASPENCMVVVFNRALKKYIETTLPELGIEGVAIKTYHQWLNSIAKEFGGGRPYELINTSAETERFKSSPILLNEINGYVTEYPTCLPVGTALPGNYRDDLFRFFHHLSKKEIFWPKWKGIAEELKQQAESRSRSQQDDSILLNLVFAREGYYPCPAGVKHAICDHIVIDEAQDFGVVEIRSLLNALNAERTVTIVGDAAQKIIMNRHFGSWEEMLREAGFADTTPVELNVSHRSTEEIMNVAAAIRGGAEIEGAKARTTRHGPEPRIIMSGSFETQPEIIAKWIKERIDENPDSLSAVICRWPKQAEKLTQILQKLGHSFVRWGHRENFDFSPGVNVTNVHQVKGLEFRNVLIVNPTEAQYSSASPEEQSLLYVAVTRAEVRLDFISKDQPTSMLPKLLRRS